MATINATVYSDEGDEITLALPAKFDVCWQCEGEGTIPDRRLSPTGDGSWTESERAEFFDNDFDMASDYFSGGYQQSCPECKGLRVVHVIDYEKADPDDVKAYEDQMRWEAEDRALQAHERRMGY
jgi:hypothetical protein